ncbi:hypothetical protein GCM10011369_23280 [Neiella marina]|uniref:NrS-1 polymerase-like helicase domain-containing protein n=2 Tax=Neiella marina TaxID=508461 RepID=A0A8J2XPE6_9GAMM|nr:hypothetical protein GCM10011369_23280 [Neiella marina]
MGAEQLNDWNDLQNEADISHVREQLNSAANDAANQSPTPSGGASDSDHNGLYDDTNRYSIDTLLEHFWFVWGTDTCWDNLNKVQIRLSHLRHGVGNDKFKAWNESFRRKTVWEIVYEPGADLDPTIVNLFEGFAVDPDSTGEQGCQRILQHLRHMCRNRETEYQFMLKWIAYPLQYPGAKMATSIVMFGAEGTGKSVVWEEVVKPIYGKHGGTIGQAQLESQFTGWKSAKSFVVAEEVVSRQERNHHKGMLKQLISGKTFRINEKNLPEHEESNHMNLVFNSNSTIPQELDEGDRRYLVLYGDQVAGKQYFDELIHEIKNGGIACFMHYMLNLDLGDFDAHTKPPMNVEKEGLIEASMPSPAYFHKQWKGGELDIPYMSAPSGDLYKYFSRWCEASGEFKRTQRFFSNEVARAMTAYRLKMNYPYINSGSKTVRVFLSQQLVARCHEAKLDSTEFNKVVAEECRKFIQIMDSNKGNLSNNGE